LEDFEFDLVVFCILVDVCSCLVFAVRMISADDVRLLLRAFLQLQQICAENDMRTK
jgi:hypothetical protein